ncbi:MBG domain-containing protein, partial [Terrabacter sp. Root181]|uniref:MBG domain-containing protein n=1 Tax=Terrabacter sp. Root181 TaxID=1736484 RepID=UPI000AA2DC46
YQVTLVNGSLTITKAPLTITADDKTRTYGDANPTFTGSILGLKNGDGITASYTTGATALTGVGTYAIVPTAVDSTPATLANYQVTLVDGTLSITKAALTVTADDKTKVYGSANPTLTGSIVGRKNGDDISATYSTAAVDSSPVDDYDITVALIDPDSRLSNYEVSVISGTLTVTKKGLTVTADDKSRTYGYANPSLTVSYSGFVLGQSASVLGGSLSVTTTATASSDVGTYPITGSGQTSGNYAITYAPGTLSVTKAPLTVTADDKGRTYGYANPSLTVSYSGFVLGQSASVLGGSPSVTTTATASSDVGTYPITAWGQTSGNYAITYAPGTLSVTKAALTVTADHKSRTYGDANPALTVSYTGFVLGQTASVLGGTLTVTTAATPASAVGTYAITA